MSKPRHHRIGTVVDYEAESTDQDSVLIDSCKQDIQIKKMKFGDVEGSANEVIKVVEKILPIVKDKKYGSEDDQRFFEKLLQDLRAIESYLDYDSTFTSKKQEIIQKLDLLKQSVESNRLGETKFPAIKSDKSEDKKEDKVAKSLAQADTKQKTVKSETKQTAKSQTKQKTAKFTGTKTATKQTSPGLFPDIHQAKHRRQRAVFHGTTAPGHRRTFSGKS